nr:MAG TPA: nucleic-acid-binding protein [Caudoviricetes sp.]
MVRSFCAVHLENNAGCTECGNKELYAADDLDIKIMLGLGGCRTKVLAT